MEEILQRGSNFCLEIAQEVKRLKYKKAGDALKPKMGIDKAGDEAAVDVFQKYISKEYLEAITSMATEEEKKMIYTKLVNCLTIVFPKEFNKMEDDFNEKGSENPQVKMLIGIKQEMDFQKAKTEALKENIKVIQGGPQGP